VILILLLWWFSWSCSWW